MGRNTGLTIITTIIAVLILFFGIQILNSLDRLRFVNEKMLEELRKRPNTTTLATQSRDIATTLDGEFANAEYFNPNAEVGDRLATVVGSDVANLNMLLCNDSTLSAIAGYCTVSLGERNFKELDKFEYLLAEEITPSEDHLNYHIKLRQGIMWHDFTDPVTGERFENIEVTANDFKFFVDVVNDETVNCAPLRSIYGSISEIEVVNDYEFIVKWSEPYFRTAELTMGLMPLPRHLYWNYEGDFDGMRFNEDHQRNNILVGCGPYELYSYEKNHRIILKRNDKYIGSHYNAMPAIEYMVFDVVSNPNTRFQMLMAGDIDQLSLTPDQWTQRTSTQEFAEDGKLTKFSNTRMAYFYIAWNQADPLFKEREVRTALTMLTDRNRILDDVYFGLGKVISGPFYINSSSNNPNISPLPFDVNEAKNLLAQAGWSDSDKDGILDKDGKKFEFTLIYPADQPMYEQILTIMKEGLAQAGINMHMQAYEWSVFIQRVEQRNFAAYTMGWSLTLDSDPYQIWHSSQADTESGSNYIDFRNAKADELITKIRQEYSAEERKKLYHEFHQLIHDEQPYTFLISPDSLNAISNRYQNLMLTPFGLADTVLWTPAELQLSMPELQ